VALQNQLPEYVVYFPTMNGEVYRLLFFPHYI